MSLTIAESKYLEARQAAFRWLKQDSKSPHRNLVLEGAAMFLLHMLPNRDCARAIRADVSSIIETKDKDELIRRIDSYFTYLAKPSFNS